MRRRLSTRDDRGETLIELMVALVIMATAVVALVGGVATSVKVSDIHRKQAKSQAYLRAFAEGIEASVANYPTGYTECTAGSIPTAPYESTFSIPPADQTAYNRQVVDVSVWNRTTSTYTACPTTGDAGVQRLTLRVWSSDDRASETLVILVREPCRPPVDPPLSSATYPDDAPCT
jgi:type II secretory pathway pseudopilin PulG